MWRKRNTPPLLVGLKAGTTTLEISWWLLRKLNIELPEDPAIQFLGIYPKDAPTCNKDACSTLLIAALFITVRSWKEPRCPSTEEWIQKVWYIYTMEYYSAIRNKDFMKFLGILINLEQSPYKHVHRPTQGRQSLIETLLCGFQVVLYRQL